MPVTEKKKPNKTTTGKDMEISFADGDDAADASADASAPSSLSSSSEDYLIFGSRPSQLFDDVSSAIDDILVEEVSTLPLLPRTLTERERRMHREELEGVQRSRRRNKMVGESSHPHAPPPATPMTGEEKLLSRLRKSYRKNLAIAEAYCDRNIFTVGHYPKTKRRLILEGYLARSDGDGEGEGEGEGEVDEDGGGSNGTTTTSVPHTSSTVSASASGDAANEELPTTNIVPTPDQISGMDGSILIARAKVQMERSRRMRLTRQLEKLKGATDTLRGVRDALLVAAAGGAAGDDHGDDGNNRMEKLRDMARRAMDGHEELLTWNARAEDAIRVLDGIKVDREGGGVIVASASFGGASNGRKRADVASREEDERERKRTMDEVGVGSHGTKGEVESFLKKLRGN
jgi:hypothetical protein